MSLPTLPLHNGALFVDASGWLENISVCPRKLQYGQLNRRIKATDATALNFGTADHLVKELRYQRFGTGSVDKEVFFTDLSTLLFRHFLQHPTPIDDWRNQSWLMELARHYIDHYPTENFSLLEYATPQPCSYCHGHGTFPPLVDIDPVLDSFKDLPCVFCLGSGKVSRMVEITFAHPLYTHKSSLGSIDIIYSGRIDLPLSLHSQLFIMDHKTSSMMGQTVFDNLNMSDQQRGYCWAFSKTTGSPITGYIPNITRTKEPPLYIQNNTPGRGKSQSPTQWWEESFQRDFHYLGVDELAEWENNSIETFETFFYHYSRGILPTNHTSCTRYGRCPYFEICSTYPPSDRGLILFSNLYKDNTWSPLKS